MRRTRIKPHKDGTCFHCMCRTVNRAFLFEDEQIREWIYQRIVWLADIYMVDLYSVTVLSNHYHIVCAMRLPEMDESDIRARFERYEAGHPSRYRAWYPALTTAWYRRLTDLSCFMKDLNQSIAHHVNEQLGRGGHLWGDRFKNTIIGGKQGLLACMTYVELNPVRAGLVEKPSRYRFCSAGRYFSGGKAAAGVVIPPLFGMEGIPAGKRQRAFKRFVDHAAMRDQGKADPLPMELVELEDWLTRFDFAEFLELVLLRTGWLANSAVVGSRQFCEELIKKYGLQPFPKKPRPYQLTDWLYTAHQRAGPFLD